MFNFLSSEITYFFLQKISEINLKFSEFVLTNVLLFSYQQYAVVDREVYFNT